MLGCKGLKTSCNQFYKCRVLPNKHHSMVFYSFTLEGTLCTLKLKFIAFINCFGYKDQQKTTATPKKIILKTLLQW